MKEEIQQTDISYWNVWFALQTLEESNSTNPLVILELVYHNSPSLPLSKEDKEKKLVYPSRNNVMRKYYGAKIYATEYLA